MKALRIFLITAFLLIVIQWSYSQNIVDSTQKANEYCQIGDYFYSANELDSSNYYYLKAADLYKKNALSSKDTMSWENYILCLYYTSWNLSINANFAKAHSILDTALTYANKYCKNRNLIISKIYAGFANLYSKESQFNLSLEFYKKTLEIQTDILGKQDILVAATFNNIGNVYYYKSEYDKALEYFFKCLDIRKKILGEKHSLVADVYNNIGNVYSDKFEFDKSLDFLFKSLNIKQSFFDENNINLASYYNNIGIAYYNKADYKNALEFFNKCLLIRNANLGEKDIYVALTYYSIGTVYCDLKEYDIALDYYLKAFTVYLENLGEIHSWVAQLYNSLGIVFFNKEDYQTSLEYFNKAVDIQKKLFQEKHSLTASYYNRIGDIFCEKHEYFKAVKYYQKNVASCILEFNDTNNIYKTPQIINYLDWSELLKGLLSKASIFADTSKKLQDNLDIFDRLQIALAHYKACDTLILQVRQQMTSKSDKISLGERANSVYTGAISTSINLAEISTKIRDISKYSNLAFFFSERNKSSVLLQELTNANALKISGLPDSLLEKEHYLSINIASYKNLIYNTQNDSLRNVWENSLFALNRSYDSLIVIFEQKYPKYFNLKYNTRTVTPQQISKILDKKSALLSYSLSDTNIFIFLITKKDFLSLRIPKPDSLDIKIDFLRQAISNVDLIKNDRKNNTNKTEKYYVDNANKFYKLLFPHDVEKLLDKHKIENLIIIPDGDLVSLPFETLLTQPYDTAKWTGWSNNNQYFANMPYLLKKYNVSYSYSATLFFETIKSSKNNKNQAKYDWIGFAPVFNDNQTAGLSLYTKVMLDETLKNDTSATRLFSNGMYISTLPGTKDEVNSIIEMFSKENKYAKLYLYDNANEKNIKSPELIDYKIIHLATHGTLDVIKPEKSAIILAQDTTQVSDSLNILLANIPQQNEGFLYVSEMYNLKLNANLVVLSACQTGLGKISKGEGVIGLSRALLYAGADNLIVSLWAVNDIATQNLMIEFYKYMIQQQQTTKYSEPLRKAKLEMIKQGLMPYFWSPFVLIGL